MLKIVEMYSLLLTSLDFLATIFLGYQMNIDYGNFASSSFLHIGSDVGVF